jgi:AcrR family transcriptional regulator
VCIARYGLGKTTLDDVARTAGCARATVYRYFPGKDVLFAAAARREWARTQARVLTAARTGATLEDALAAAVGALVSEYHEHPALAFVLAHEPEIVLPHVSFDACRVVLGAGADLVVQVAAPFLAAADARRLGEWLTRLVVSCLLSPSETFALGDPAAVRRLLREYVLPSLPSRSTEPALRG